MSVFPEDIGEKLSERISLARSILNSHFVSREFEIDTALVALISKQTMIMIGPPGTAKTALIESVARLIGGRYFYYLLTRFTEPDELLGPLDIALLKEGIYKRRTEGRLLEAHIAFLDEIFRASSAIRNVLLDIILNRRFEGKDIPLITLYSASNEVSRDTEDQAIYDRFVCRNFVDNIDSPSWKQLLEVEIDFEVEGGYKKIEPIMTLEDVMTLNKIVLDRLRSLKNSSLINTYLEVLADLRNKNLEPSDRRKGKILLIAASYSVIRLSKSVSKDDLAEALRVCVPYDREDLETVEEVIYKHKLSTHHDIIQKIETLTTEIKNMSDIKTLEDMRRAVTLRREALLLLSSIPKDLRLLRHVRGLVEAVEELDRRISAGSSHA